MLTFVILSSLRFKPQEMRCFSQLLHIWSNSENYFHYSLCLNPHWTWLLCPSCQILFNSYLSYIGRFSYLRAIPLLGRFSDVAVLVLPRGNPFSTWTNKMLKDSLAQKYSIFNIHEHFQILHWLLYTQKALYSRLGVQKLKKLLHFCTIS